MKISTETDLRCVCGHHGVLWKHVSKAPLPGLGDIEDFELRYFLDGGEY